MAENAFEPSLIAFCCHNSAYAREKDTITGNSALVRNLKIVELPCSGKMEVLYFLKAFEEGADGVYLVGCPLEDCHYLEGNLRARGRIEQAKKLLSEVGIGGERVELFLLDRSASEGFQEATRRMIDRVRELGPSPLKKGVIHHA